MRQRKVTAWRVWPERQGEGGRETGRLGLGQEKGGERLGRGEGGGKERRDRFRPKRGEEFIFF